MEAISKSFLDTLHNEPVKGVLAMRTISFPETRSVGALLVKNKDSARSEDWQYLGEARGMIVIAEHQALHLTVIPQPGEESVAPPSSIDLSPLVELKADDLQSLRLSKVSDGGLVQIQGLTRLQALDLSLTWISSFGVNYIRSLTSLQALSVGMTNIDDVGLGVLSELTSLQYINLQDTQVSNGGMSHLHTLPELRSLVLNGTHIDSDGVQILHSNTNLRELYLSGTKVDNDAILYLRNINSLETLDISHSLIDDGAIAYLQDITTLKTIYLIETNMSVTGLNKLSSALSECRIITS
jgi:hypothetical protein